MPDNSKNVQLQNQVCDIVAEVLGLDTRIDPDNTFKSLGADSIDMATLIVTLQDEFPASDQIDESAFANITTPGEIAEFINTHS